MQSMVKPELPDEWNAATDIVNLVRQLGRTSLSDRIDGRFRDGVDNRLAVRAMMDAGLFGLTLPRRYGGMGRDYLALAAACEELGAIDTAHQVSLTVHLALASMAILQWGTPSQCDRWLPRLARGDEQATFALTEPGAGTDVGALQMRARETTGGYILNGEKSWISDANTASVFLLFATLDPELRHRGITGFIVPRGSAGLSTTVLHGKLGLRAGDTGTVVCQDVFVPTANLLGEPGEGFAVALAALGNGPFTVGAGSVGIAAEARRHTVALLHSVDYPAGGWAAGELAEMVARETSARQLVARSAIMKNQGLPNNRETALAKWTAADAGYRNADAALTIHQALAGPEHPALERLLANAKGAVIYGGTSEIHQTMQAGYALGSRRERPYRRPALTALDLQ
jgi:glutaryl-CoA dehydrogenase (non-decarboxylating)